MNQIGVYNYEEYDFDQIEKGGHINEFSVSQLTRQLEKIVNFLKKIISYEKSYYLLKLELEALEGFIPKFIFSEMKDANSLLVKSTDVLHYLKKNNFDISLSAIDNALERIAGHNSLDYRSFVKFFSNIN